MQKQLRGLVGAIALTLVLLVAIPAGASAQGPTVSVTPTSAARGETIHVSGSGYVAKYTVILFVRGDTWSRAYSTRSDANGNISDLTGKGNNFPLTIPCDVPPGSYTLYASSYNAGGNSPTAQTKLTVTSGSKGSCVQPIGPPVLPGNPTPTVKLSHKFFLGFNIKVKRKSLAAGQMQTVIANVHWSGVFKGKMQVIYDKHHHLAKSVHTNKRGVLTYRFHVKYHPSRSIKAKLVVQLAGTVDGLHLKGKQHATFTVNP